MSGMQAYSGAAFVSLTLVTKYHYLLNSSYAIPSYLLPHFPLTHFQRPQLYEASRVDCVTTIKV